MAKIKCCDCGFDMEPGVICYKHTDVWDGLVCEDCFQDYIDGLRTYSRMEVPEEDEDGET